MTIYFVLFVLRLSDSLGDSSFHDKITKIVDKILDITLNTATITNTNVAEKHTLITFTKVSSKLIQQVKALTRNIETLACCSFLICGQCQSTSSGPSLFCWYHNYGKQLWGCIKTRMLAYKWCWPFCEKLPVIHISWYTRLNFLVDSGVQVAIVPAILKDQKRDPRKLT